MWSPASYVLCVLQGADGEARGHVIPGRDPLGGWNLDEVDQCCI